MTAIYELSKTYGFEAAHYLSQVPQGHQCGGVHGHSYIVELIVEGPLDVDMGWVVDFAELTGAIKPVIDALDHKLLNDIPGLSNPTSELLAKWIYNSVSADLPLLVAVRVSETPRSSCTYRPKR